MLVRLEVDNTHKRTKHGVTYPQLYRVENSKVLVLHFSLFTLVRLDRSIYLSRSTLALFSRSVYQDLTTAGNTLIRL